MALTHGGTPKSAPSLLFSQAAGRQVIRVLLFSLQEPGELRPAPSVPPRGNPRPRAQAHLGCAGSRARALPDSGPSRHTAGQPPQARVVSLGSTALQQRCPAGGGEQSFPSSGQRPRPPSLRSQSSWAQAPWGECVTVPHGGRRTSHPFPTMQVGSRETCCLWWVRKLRPGAQVSRRQMQSCYGRARLGPAWAGQGRGGVAGTEGRGQVRGGMGGGVALAEGRGLDRGGEVGQSGVVGAEGQRGPVRGGVARSGEARPPPRRPADAASTWKALQWVLDAGESPHHGDALAGHPGLWGCGGEPC